uniref:Uncharacterized protein n=1 Tax=Arundo donax TaxID=35708 RepID=A0A0A9H959_ARUDO
MYKRSRSGLLRKAVSSLPTFPTDPVLARSVSCFSN